MFGKFLVSTLTAMNMALSPLAFSKKDQILVFDLLVAEHVLSDCKQSTARIHSKIELHLSGESPGFFSMHLNGKACLTATTSADLQQEINLPGELLDPEFIQHLAEEQPWISRPIPSFSDPHGSLRMRIVRHAQTEDNLIPISINELNSPAAVFYFAATKKALGKVQGLNAHTIPIKRLEFAEGYFATIPIRATLSRVVSGSQVF